MSETNGNGAVMEAAIVKEGDGDVELRAIELDPGSGSSTQPADFELWTPDDTITPPEDLDSLSRLTDFSSIREACIAALTRNVVGLGWDVDVWPGEQATPDEIADARQSIDVLARRDHKLDKPSLSTLLSAVKWDHEECGNGAIEVSRNRNTGKIDGLYHAQGKLVRRKKDESGYVIGQSQSMVENPARVDYYNFGEKVIYDAQGRPTPRLKTPQLGWKRNELIVFRRYTSKSRHYGLPRDLGLAVEYAAARFVNEWTASFFEGSGTPPTLLFVAGKESKNGGRITFTVPTQTVNRIQQAVRADAKPGARVAIIPVPPGTEVKDVKLGALSDKDITFGEFKKMHRGNVRSSMGPLSPIFTADPDEGRYTAEVQRAITLEQVFDPDQREWEDRLWNTILTDLGLAPMKLKFKRLAVEGDAVRREAAVAMAEADAITVGEFREAHGYGPLDERLHGQGVNDQLVSKAKPRGAEDRVTVRATEDTRGLRPGLAGRVAKSGGGDEHEHGVEHVEEVVDELESELVALASGDGDDG